MTVFGQASQGCTVDDSSQPHASGVPQGSFVSINLACNIPMACSFSMLLLKCLKSLPGKEKLINSQQLSFTKTKQTHFGYAFLKSISV